LSIGMMLVVAAALTLGPAVISVCSRFGRVLEPKRLMQARGWRRVGTATVRWPGAILVSAIAAIEGVITRENAGRVQAEVIVEGANGPTTTEADLILRQRGVLVVSDTLANAGGVVVSYFEWVQANQAYWWSETEVNTKLVERMTRAWDCVVEYAADCELSLRQAATALAVQHVTEAHRLRGLNP
jgi:glutamate dehydrogenase/leucine dehydrogenase